MRNGIRVFLIISIVILIISIFSGCIEEKRSAINEINLSASLTSSGKSRIEKIDLASGSYSDARIKLNASKYDYEEALRILNNATTDYDEEKEVIETNKLIGSYSLDSIATLQNLIDNLEHLNKASSYLVNDDVISARSELKLAEEALNKARPFVSSAKGKILKLNIDAIPVESRSEILEDKSGIEKAEKMLDEYGKILSGMYPYVDGMEHLLRANEYLANETWKNAELEFGNSSSDFMRAKSIFIDLRNSEFPEISVIAIQIDGASKKISESLSHLEAGSRYASQGNFVKANEEFIKAGQEIQS